MPKNYGPNLSRYLDPRETGFDTVVYQAGKPLLDSEFVLDQEIQNGGRATLIRETTPSGWLTGDFGRDANYDFDFRGEPDTFYLNNKPVVNVGGYIIPVEYTGTADPGENQIVLGTPPAGSFAADFVYLEVWRVVLGPDPLTDNKPAADKIYRHGNVLSPSATWLDDDLLGNDPGIDPQYQINVESTRRVQIQYRIRHARLTDETTRSAVGAYAAASTFAQGASSGVTTFQYSPDPNDPGLWVAGDGDPSNTLGTVDGYVYSIPLAIVYRRNSNGFDFRSNGNGSSLIASGTTLHPDGVFADEIIFDDILDLRNQVSLTGFDQGYLLSRNVDLLMAQKLRSSAMYSQGAGWQVGGSNFVSNLVLKADDLVPTTGSSTYPTTGGFTGNIIGFIDGIRKTFTDKAHHELYVRAYDSGVDWNTPSVTLSLDLANVYNPVPVPTGVVITDVVSVTLDDEVGGTSPTVLEILSVTGLGTSNVSVEFDTTGITSSRDIWVEYEVHYPAGSGLNAHVTEETGSYAVTVHDPSAYNGAIGTTFTNDDAGRAAIRDYIFADFNGANREVVLTHTTEDPVSLLVYSEDSTTIVLPESLYEDAQGTVAGVVSVSDGSNTYAVDGAATSNRTIALADPLPSNSERVTVEYYPLRPLPPVASDLTVYYKTNAIQPIPTDMLGATLDVQPLLVGSHMWVGTGSSGSHTVGFPHEAGLQQVPVSNEAAAIFNGEHDLDAPGPISITGFDALASCLRIPVVVPMAMPDTITLSDPFDTDVEQEERMGHYIGAEANGYKPTALAPPLSSGVRHKCFLPMLVQTREDTDYARRGELLMVILSNYIEGDTGNTIAFLESDNTSCAAIYRIKGKPLTYAG